MISSIHGISKLRPLRHKPRAFGEPRSMIRQYEEMIRQADPDEVTEKRQAEMELLKSQVKAIAAKEW